MITVYLHPPLYIKLVSKLVSRKSMFLLAVFVVFGCASKSGRESVPRSEPPTIQTQSSFDASDTGPDVSAEDADNKSASVDDLSCTEDRECSISYLSEACCQMCTPQARSSEWITKVAKQCGFDETPLTRAIPRCGEKCLNEPRSRFPKCNKGTCEVWSRPARPYKRRGSATPKP